MPTYIALLRGINVGRAKRMAMAELRVLVGSLGMNGVRSVLNSGNVIFESSPTQTAKLAATLSAAIGNHFGFAVPVVVISADELDVALRENPLPAACADASHFLLAFAADAASLARTRSLLSEDWSPEVLAVGRQVAYLHCPQGIVDSKLVKVFTRLAGETCTTRNWATLLKLQASSRRAQ